MRPPAPSAIAPSWRYSPGLEARLAGVAAIIDGTFRDAGFPLVAPLSELVASSGKMLRPALLIVGSLFGRAAKPERIDSFAAAIELLHVATLIHDDVIDEADFRRGVPTLHGRFGSRNAVLAGDWLLSRCFLLSSAGAEAGRAESLARLVGAICGAEIAQDLKRYSFDSSVRKYLRTIAGKTAALFSLALHAGATEGKAEKGTTQALRRAGYDIGMAFQVIDDILDLEASAESFGKPVGKDLREGLSTLPLIRAIEADPAGMRALLARIAPDRPDEAAVAEAVARTVELGGLERARETARTFTGRALAEIGRLPSGEARDELTGIAEGLLSRNY